MGNGVCRRARQSKARDDDVDDEASRFIRKKEERESVVGCMLLCYSASYSLVYLLLYSRGKARQCEALA